MTTISKEQNAAAAKAAAENLTKRFSDAEITVEVVAHSAGKKFDFVRINCAPNQWRAVAKHLKHELGVNHCAMVTGTHYPEGSAETGWEVAYHMHRWPIQDVEAHTMTVHKGESLQGDDIPMEFEIFIPLEAGDSPSVPSVQDLGWSRLEREGNLGFSWYRFRRTRKHAQSVKSSRFTKGFHPLQRQHKIRYHDFNEMYDDPQGFDRKPVDEGRVK